MHLTEENLLDLSNQSLETVGGVNLGSQHPRDFTVPESLGCGFLKYDNPREDFLCVKGRHDLSEDLTIDFSSEYHADPTPRELEIGVMLEGELGLPKVNKFDSDCILKAGQFGLWRSSGENVHRVIHGSGSPIKYFVMQVAESTVADFMGIEVEDIVAHLSGEFSGYENGSRFTSAADAELLIAARQYISASFAGGLQRMYLEAKAIEVLTLAINRLIQDREIRATAPSLSASDIDKMYEAHDYLMQRLETPPTLIELAHAVGTNEHKLKVGFKQVFGTTVFGCLRAARLEEARRRLLVGEQSVTQVALSIGFLHFGHFSCSFRQRFGMPPSEYLRKARSLSTNGISFKR